MAKAYDHLSDHDLIDLIQKTKADFDLLEAEAIRRAMEGTPHDIVYRGVVVGEMRLYSDTLLDFMLRSVAPHG